MSRQKGIRLPYRSDAELEAIHSARSAYTQSLLQAAPDRKAALSECLLLRAGAWAYSRGRLSGTRSQVGKSGGVCIITTVNTGIATSSHFGCAFFVGSSAPAGRRRIGLLKDIPIASRRVMRSGWRSERGAIGLGPLPFIHPCVRSRSSAGDLPSSRSASITTRAALRAGTVCIGGMGNGSGRAIAPTTRRHGARIRGTSARQRTLYAPLRPSTTGWMPGDGNERIRTAQRRWGGGEGE